MRMANLLLAFLLELAMLAAWAWKGWNVPLPEPLPALAAILVPLFVIAVWGLFAAPKARYPLSTRATVALKGALLGGGALALASTGQTLLGAIDGILVAVNLILAGLWGQLERPMADPLRQRLKVLLDDYARRWSEGTVGRFRRFSR